MFDDVSFNDNTGFSDTDSKIKNEVIFRQNRDIYNTKNLDKLSEFYLPKKNECLDFITNKNLNFASFLLFIDATKIKRLIIAIYRINNMAIGIISELKKINPNIVIEIILQKNIEKMTPDIFEKLNRMANINFIYCDNHCKFACIETIEDYFVLVGSGNLSKNARYEQYTVRNNKELFYFYSNFFNDLDKLQKLG